MTKSKEKNMAVERVNCIIGAGAAIDIGAPSSHYITKIINEKNKFIADISSRLDSYYGRDGFNFEDVFHAIETLRSYSNIDQARKGYKPLLGAFASINQRWFLNSTELIKAETQVLKVISELIINYDSKIMEEPNEWYVNFWKELNEIVLLDMFTLNYDSTLEKPFGDFFNDGFVEVKGTNYMRFKPQKVMCSEMPRIMNLHGSIYYGYLNDKDVNRFALEDDFNELYKYRQHNDSLRTWFGRSSNYAQSGDIAQVSPIITGLRKTDKLISFPMSVYSNIFTSSIFTNPLLLICGYSFGDKHINKVIEKVTSIHGSNRRIVLITYISNEQRHDWCPDPSSMEWLDHETFTFIVKAFNENRPFENSLEYTNPLKSKDGKVLIYFEGFKNTVESYKGEIFEHFTI